MEDAFFFTAVFGLLIIGGDRKPNPAQNITLSVFIDVIRSFGCRV